MVCHPNTILHYILRKSYSYKQHLVHRDKSSVRMAGTYKTLVVGWVDNLTKKDSVQLLVNHVSTYIKVVI